jgi:hypothetical protein
VAQVRAELELFDLSLLKQAEEYSARLAKRLLAKKPTPDMKLAWQIGLAWRVSNSFTIHLFQIAHLQFVAEEGVVEAFHLPKSKARWPKTLYGADYRVMLPTGPVYIEVKGSLTDRTPPWPVSKGMGGSQRGRYRGLVSRGYHFVLFQVAVRTDGSVKAAIIPLTLRLVSGKETAQKSLRPTNSS